MSLAFNKTLTWVLIFTKIKTWFWVLFSSLSGLCWDFDLGFNFHRNWNLGLGFNVLTKWLRWSRKFKSVLTSVKVTVWGCVIGEGHEISDMSFLLEELEVFLKIAFLVVFGLKITYWKLIGNLLKLIKTYWKLIGNLLKLIRNLLETY